ncbi:hypothetical protein [Comamonas antarctica]|uniref:hypothetical protein n=1 Tax=Comamonas antarctica TaxID=2743470 RepID=UPI0028F04E48|nr:hypothetical protein [Comamonas antarctica]
MNEEKLTPWFVNGEKPARKGVYNVSCRSESQTGRWYSWWDGKTFGAFATNLDRAKEYHLMHPGARIASLGGGSWRGLAYDPRAANA